MGQLKNNVAEAIKALDAARALLVGGNMPIRVCANCGVEFVPEHPSAKFHSNGCRQAAYRKRKADVPTEIR